MAPEGISGNRAGCKDKLRERQAQRARRPPRKPSKTTRTSLGWRVFSKNTVIFLAKSLALPYFRPPSSRRIPTNENPEALITRRVLKHRPT